MRILAIFALGTLLLSSAAYGQGRSTEESSGLHRDETTGVGSPTRTTEPTTLTLENYSVDQPDKVIEPPASGPKITLEGIRTEGGGAD